MMKQVLLTPADQRLLRKRNQAVRGLLDIVLVGLEGDLSNEGLRLHVSLARQVTARIEDMFVPPTPPPPPPTTAH